MLKKTITLSCVLALLAGYAYAKPVAYDFRERKPVNSALRSLILPGWGQQFNGQKTKGYVITGAALLTLAGSYMLYTKANNTYDDYQNQGIKNSTLYDDYQAQSNQAMIASLLCAGVWIYGVVDAYIFGKDNDDDLRSQSLPALRLACGRGETRLLYSKRF